jgi:glycosyltransferase involved in cell wall biosynthesis
MVTAISMVKDELDVVESFVRHTCTQVDRMIVADNASSDGTRDVLDELARDLPLTVLDDPETGYWQSLKMSALAARAAVDGAEWVLPADCDEWWYSPFGRIADVLAELDGASIAGAQLFDHVPTALDPNIADPFQRIGWRRRDPAPLMKVAAKARPAVTIHQGNHGADHGHRVDGVLVVRHLPLRSPEQMIRKARNGGRAYAATNLPEDHGQHWRDWNRLSDEQLGDVFRRFYWSADPEHDEGLIFDPAPSS